MAKRVRKDSDQGVEEKDWEPWYKAFLPYRAKRLCHPDQTKRYLPMLIEDAEVLRVMHKDTVTVADHRFLTYSVAGHLHSIFEYLASIYGDQPIALEDSYVNPIGQIASAASDKRAAKPKIERIKESILKCYWMLDYYMEMLFLNEWTDLKRLAPVKIKNILKWPKKIKLIKATDMGFNERFYGAKQTEDLIGDDAAHNEEELELLANKIVDFHVSDFVFQAFAPVFIWTGLLKDYQGIELHKLKKTENLRYSKVIEQGLEAINQD